MSKYSLTKFIFNNIILIYYNVESNNKKGNDFENNKRKNIFKRLQKENCI